MTKRRYEGEQTKAEILDKARTLFSQKGYAATSMDDICNATGRSIGNVYYYFKSKEELFLYLFEQIVVEIQENLKGTLSNYESVTGKLYAYGDYLADMERPLNSAEREFITKVGTESESGKRFLALINQTFAGFQNLIAEGIARGELINENLFDLSFIISCYYGGLNHYAIFMDKETKKALFRKGTTLLLGGIGAKDCPAVNSNVPEGHS